MEPKPLSSTAFEEEEASLRTQWQVIVCAMIIAVPLVAARAVVLKLEEANGDRLRASDLWTSCWTTVHPLWLLAYRSSATVAMSWMLCQTCLLFGSFAFFFYTTWTLVLVIVYFMIASLVSVHGCWLQSKEQVSESEDIGSLNMDLILNASTPLTSQQNKNSDKFRILQSHREQEINGKGVEILGYAMQIAYQTSAGAIMMTDIVFWGLLVPFLADDNFSLSTIMCCLHSLNVVFLLFDTVLNNLPFPWFRIAYLVLWSGIYTVSQWILYACGITWWPYPFLDLSTPWAPVWYIGLALVHIPSYGLYWLAAKTKNSLFTNIFPRAYLKS